MIEPILANVLPFTESRWINHGWAYAVNSTTIMANNRHQWPKTIAAGDHACLAMIIGTAMVVPSLIPELTTHEAIKINEITALLKARFLKHHSDGQYEKIYQQLINHGL